MISTELIARAICQHGKCEKCDSECIDYRAAQRVMTAIEADAAKEVSKDGNQV